MKSKLLVTMVLALACFFLFAVDQVMTPDSPNYDSYKQNQTYTPEVMTSPTHPTMAFNIGDSPKTDPDLLVPLDATFIQAMAPNDDGYTDNIVFPFTFTLYGANYTSCWINNNGNISFDGGYSSYTPWGFPIDGSPMVAAFFADVDTRAAGTVWYKIESNRMIVIWDHVGYYQQASDKLNTFELIITDGTDPAIGLGNTVAFSYGDMQWTTGSASGGSEGFGGTAATVGINKGSGSLYAQVGRFDHAGYEYDGPFDVNDGVDWLDGKLFYFNTVNAATMVITPTTIVNVSGSGLPGGLDPTDPTLYPYLASYPIAGFQTVTIPVGPGIWYGWAYYGGAWHQADVFPVYGPGTMVFSNVPFGAKSDVPIILDSDPVIAPIPESSLPAGYPDPCPIEANPLFRSLTVTWSGTHDVFVARIPNECHAFAYIGGTWTAASAPNWTWTNVDMDANNPLYVVTFSPTLPVELSSFTAVVTAQNFVKLTWVTQSETGLSGYNIYRNSSNNSANATHIGFVTSNNSSTQQIYTLTDNEVEIDNSYYYWLQSVEYNGSSTLYGPVLVNVEGSDVPEIPVSTVMGSAYPNPFVTATNIDVSVKAGEQAQVSIYNLTGQLIRSYTLSEGSHTINWDGKDSKNNLCGSGIYFYRLTSPSVNQTRKMMIVK